MTKRETWHEFVFDNSSYGEPRDSYSGRSMYGKSVLAVTFDNDGDINLFLQELGAFLDENGHEYIRCLKTDSMGT